MSEAKVRVSRGRTVNLGNFESERIDISIEETCTVETMDAIYEKLSEWAETRMLDEVDRIMEDKK